MRQRYLLCHMDDLVSHSYEIEFIRMRYVRIRKKTYISHRDERASHPCKIVIIAM